LSPKDDLKFQAAIIRAISGVIYSTLNICSIDQRPLQLDKLNSFFDLLLDLEVAGLIQ